MENKYYVTTPIAYMNKSSYNCMSERQDNNFKGKA